MSANKGMTLLEVLVAVILASGALATLATWAYKAPWNQASSRRMKAQLLLESTLSERLSSRPAPKGEERTPVADGWTVIWKWEALPENGWSLQGRVLDARGREVRTLWAARWW